MTIEGKSIVSICVNDMLSPQVIYNTSVNRSISTSPQNIGYSETVVDGRFVGTSGQVVLLLKSTVGYIFKYIYFKIEGTYQKVRVVITNDTVIPLNLVPLAYLYNYRFVYNKLTNKAFIGFNAIAICYFADYPIKYCGNISYPSIGPG